VTTETALDRGGSVVLEFGGVVEGAVLVDVVGVVRVVAVSEK